LIGEPARQDVRKAILAFAGREAGIERICSLLTFQLGPEQVVAMLSVRFRPHLTSREIEIIVCDLRDRIRRDRPEVVGLFIGPPTGD
jgi:divalent metal cation (Fe/Co/Zn/Cd) transporter